MKMSQQSQVNRINKTKQNLSKECFSSLENFGLNNNV